MKRSLALTLAMPVLTLAVGIAIGSAMTRPGVTETVVIAAQAESGLTAHDQCIAKAQSFAESNAAKSGQTILNITGFWQADRDTGVICKVRFVYQGTDGVERMTDEITAHVM